jgi:uncharacterized membrane protein YphA (DoxX/SURF4 family)
MLIAILTVHLGHGLFTKNGGYEYPLTLLLASLFFAFHGAGPISFDAFVEKAPARARRALRMRGLRIRQRLPNQPL